MKTVIRNSYTPKVGDYCETIVVDKESEDAYIFDCDGIFTPMPQPVDVEDILRRAAEYTDETVAPLEEKLDTIEEGAQVNVIETITQNGQPLTVTDKTVNVTVPTKTSDLENDGSDGTDTYVESSALDDYYTKSETDTQIGYETDAREIADSGLQEQIDAIVASSDVVDIVGTYAALQAYDTSKLHDNDIIKVLTDETRDDATTYYRWDADTSTWSYIGAEGPFYTKAESDALFTPMTRTVNGKALTTDITLTAADVHALPDSTVIPTVNDATLTIQKNGTNVATFTANSASNQTANITVPVDTSDLTNDGDGQSPFATEDYVDTYGGKIDTIEVNGTAQPIVNKTVDITVPTKTSDLTNDGSDGTDTYVEAGDLATVATTGDYDDLTNKPTIPTVNDATLTIQKNGTDVATFTANSSTNQTANITVPTDTSDLTNGAGFITSSALSNYYTKSETYSQGEVNNLINSLSIPTKTSDLTNDSGFITLTDIPTASANDLGLIRIGTGLSIDQDGIVSVTSAGSVDWDDVTNRPTNVSYWTNDAGYITSAAIPTNVSSFTNDAGYITSSAIPTNVSAFTNDAGYLTSSSLSNYYTKSETYNQSQVNSLINSISVPTKTSDLTNDGSDGTSTYVEADDLATVATSGSYNDLSNKPTIPTIVDMTGATSSAAGAHGYVPAPAAGDNTKFLRGDGTWVTPADEIYTAGNGINIDANNEISVDTAVVATQTDLDGKQDTLTAGSNMTISNNVISAKVDSALSASSANPVQNSVVKAALDGKNKTIWTAYNLSPAANTPTSWKTLLGGEGIYWTWYNTSDKFTNQPSRYGLLRTVIGASDVRQDFYVQSGGTHYYRAGNGTGWYGTAGDAGAFRNLGSRKSPGSYFGTCSTAAATADKVVTVSADQDFTLTIGAMVTFALPATNTAQNPTINVNNTGAKSVKYNSSVITTGNLNRVGYSTRPTTFVYDGTYWVWVSWSCDDNTTYSAMSVSEGQTGTATTARLMRADYLKQIIQYYNPTKTSDLTNDGSDGGSTYVEADQLATVAASGSYNDLTNKPTIPTVNDATLTIQKNGTNVQTFTANSSSNKVANIQVPNLQTSSTDPGEGSTLAADTFLGIYDIAPEDVDGARITNATITAAKLAGKAKIADVTSSTRSFAATNKGVLFVSEPFESSNTSRGTAKITFSGASGSTVTPRSSVTGLAYNANKVYGLALVNAGDNVTWTTTYSNAGGFPDWGADHGFSLFIPCNW